MTILHETLHAIVLVAMTALALHQRKKKKIVINKKQQISAAIPM